MTSLFKSNQKVLFFDVRTAPLSIHPVKHWQGGEWKDEAGKTPEFGQVIAATLAYFKDGKPCVNVVMGSFEKDILEQAAGSLDMFFDKGWKICLSNYRFVVPFFNRRVIYHEVKIPYPFRAWMFKPWEMEFIVDLSAFLGFNGIYPCMDDVMALYGLEIDKGGLIDNYFTGNNEFIKNICNKQIKGMMALYNKVSKCV